MNGSLNNSTDNGFPCNKANPSGVFSTSTKGDGGYASGSGDRVRIRFKATPSGNITYDGNENDIESRPINYSYIIWKRIN